MGSLPDKLNYLKETKSMIKEVVNEYGGELTEQTAFRDYVPEIERLLQSGGGGTGSGDSVPTGSVVGYTGDDVPEGWQEVDGYPSLDITVAESFDITSKDIYGVRGIRYEYENDPIIIDNVSYSGYTSVRAFSMADDGPVALQVGVITYSDTKQLHRKFIYRYLHGSFGSGDNWKSIITDVNSYSSTEQVVGTWINGEPLYRKVVDFGHLPMAASWATPHGISNLGIVTSIHATAKNPSTGIQFQVPNLGLIPDIAEIDMKVDNTYVWMWAEDELYDYECYVVLEYTKTAS